MTVDTILIVGMHRSGTSCLAGSLEEAGLYLGDVSIYSKRNEKGNRENRAVMTLNNTVMHRHETDWDNPPDDLLEWNEEELEQLRQIIATYPKNRLWGVKDPRILFTLKGWAALTSPRFVGTFRHPVEVKDSLVFRAVEWSSTFDPELAYDLWEAHNSRMLALYDDTPFDIVRYDIAPELYEQKLNIIASHLGLETGPSHFRNEELHYQQTNDADIPDRLRPTWDRLNAIAI